MHSNPSLSKLQLQSESVSVGKSQIQQNNQYDRHYRQNEQVDYQSQKANQPISFEQKKHIAALIQKFDKVQLKYILTQILKCFDIVQVRDGCMRIQLDQLREKDFPRLQKQLHNAVHHPS